jgi:hypothetical protein
VTSGWQRRRSSTTCASRSTTSNMWWGNSASTRLCLCPSHTLSTDLCTSKFIANFNSFYWRVTKVSLLTNWLFLVVGGRGRGRRLQPLFWRSCSST